MNRTRKKFEHYSDAELLDSFKINGDKKIISELYNRYGYIVMETCLNYLKNKNDAEDIVIGIFMSLGDKIIKHEINYFKSWLFVLSKNSYLMVLKKKKHPSYQQK